jgi:hypothetical protein
MPIDLTAIPTALAALKGAREAVATLIKSSTALETAELQLKYAELAGALAGSQIALARAAEVQDELRAVVSRLEAAHQIRGKVQRSGEACFMLDESGSIHGDPTCLHCWEQDARIVSLTSPVDNPRGRSCPRCETVVRFDRIVWPRPT